MNVLYVAVFVFLAFLNVSQAWGPVMFSVGMNNHADLPANDKVIYNTVFTNLGNAYDPRTGVFTSRTAGVYKFEVHALSSAGNRQARLSIRHNNKDTVTLYSAPNTYNTASNTVILQLSEGDTVYVVAYIHSAHLYGTHAEIYSTFTGIMLAEVEQTFKYSMVKVDKAA